MDYFYVLSLQDSNMVSAQTLRSDRINAKTILDPVQNTFKNIQRFLC
jgi:hypothetical protein